jgi:hypothetical protein
VKPTTKQLRYLRDLANSRGQTFRYPQTRAEASAEIRRLRARRPDSRLARAVERREGERAVPREQFDAAAVTPAGDQRLRQPRALGGPGQRAMSAAGERVELARYQVDTGERVLYGQRINGRSPSPMCPPATAAASISSNAMSRARPPSTSSSHTTSPTAGAAANRLPGALRSRCSPRASNDPLPHTIRRCEPPPGAP